MYKMLLMLLYLLYLANHQSHINVRFVLALGNETIIILLYFLLILAPFFLCLTFSLINLFIQEIKREWGANHLSSFWKWTSDNNNHSPEFLWNLKSNREVEHLINLTNCSFHGIINVSCNRSICWKTKTWNSYFIIHI